MTSELHSSFIFLVPRLQPWSDVSPCSTAYQLPCTYFQSIRHLCCVALGSEPHMSHFPVQHGKKTTLFLFLCLKKSDCVYLCLQVQRNSRDNLNSNSNFNPLRNRGAEAFINSVCFQTSGKGQLRKWDANLDKLLLENHKIKAFNSFYKMSYHNHS